MKAYFQKLFRYNQWANIGLCEHIQKIADPPREVMKRMSHIVAAEEIWFQRVQPLGFDPLPSFEIQSWDILEPRLEQSAQRWLGLIARIDDFEIAIDYINLSGKLFTSPLSDVLIHMANHGSYHRGQIATLLRQHGHEPLPTDFILFTRG
jgi:uncharacterized damage-inducible protein DinB